MNYEELVGLTIAEAADKLDNGYIDVDIADTEIDMMVAFVHVNGDVSDNHDKFLELLAKKVKITKVMYDEDGLYRLICDISSFYKPFNDKINKWYDKYGGHDEFDDAEGYYDLVLYTESLVAGFESEKVYAELLEVLR